MHSKPTIYLHIGAGKTGSTSLQVWLKNAETALADAGYLIFDTNFEPSAQHEPLSNQQEYFHAVFSQGIEGVRSFQHKFQENLQFMRIHGYHSAVISAENLLNPWLQAHKLFEPFIHECNWKIIVYVRNQADYLISAWKQWGFLTQDFETYVSKHTHADWMSIITPWDSTFGKDSMYVGVLASSSLKNGFLTHDFAYAIGVPHIASHHPTDIRTHPSINFQTISLLAKIRQQYILNNPSFISKTDTKSKPNDTPQYDQIQETLLLNDKLNRLFNYKSLLSSQATLTSLQNFNSIHAYVDQTTLDTIHATYNDSNQRLLARYRPDIDCHIAFPRIVNSKKSNISDIDHLLHGIHVLLETTNNLYNTTKQHQHIVHMHQQTISFHTDQQVKIQDQFVNVQQQLDQVQHQLKQMQSALNEISMQKNPLRYWTERLWNRLARRSKHADE